MKKMLIALCIVSMPGLVFSQNRNNVFAEVAVPCPLLFTDALGAAVTYDRRVIKHLDVGLGAQVNDYTESSYYRNREVGNVRKAVYADIRPYVKVKRSLFFFVCDIGYDFYEGERDQWFNDHNNALYTGAGFGYGHVVNKRGLMPYVTFKLVADDYTEHQYLYWQTNHEQEITYYQWWPFFVFSVGAKF